MDELSNALSIVGENEEIRLKIIELLKEAEKADDSKNYRDEVTAHIVDAMCQDLICCKELANGLKFEFPYKSKIAREFVLSTPEKPNHVWEPQTTKLLLHLTKDAKQVIIGGAYFGDQAILIANQINSNGGTVHAFEPSVSSSVALKRNAEINHLQNIVINRAGLWNKKNVTLRFVGDDALAGSEESGATDDYTYPAFIIDDYIEKNGIEKIDLIQLDIEGGELAALEGASKQIEKFYPHIVFEIHSLYSDWSNGLANTEIIRFLKSYDYSVYAVRDFHHNHDTGNLPIEISLPEKTYIDGPPHGFNMLAVKDSSIVQADNFRMVKNVSPKYLMHKEAELFHPLNHE